MKKAITTLVTFVLVLCLASFVVSAKTLPGSSNTQYPVLIKENIRAVSFSEVVSGLEKTEGLNRRKAAEYIINNEKAFEKLHPEISASHSNIFPGYYEYVQLSRSEYFGQVYWKHYGIERSRSVVVQQFVYVEVYVDESSRQFVWVSDPFTTPVSGGYTWHLTYNHTRQDSPTQFTAMSSGYAEVSTSSSIFFCSLGSTYYYRKTCDFPIWTYNLRNW